MRRLVVPACVRCGLLSIATSLAGVGCSDPGPCATAGHDDGSYTLALDGLCLDGVTVDHRVDGAWQAAGTELQWRAAASGGLEVTLVADAPAQALELAIPALDVDRMFQQGYQSWSFSGTVEIPLMVPLDDDGRARMTAARTGSAIDEARGVSFETALFRKGETGRVLVVAALSAERAVTGIAATHDVGGPPRLSIIYGPQRELLAPEPGDGRAHSELLYLATADTPGGGARAGVERAGRRACERWLHAAATARRLVLVEQHVHRGRCGIRARRARSRRNRRCCRRACRSSRSTMAGRSRGATGATTPSSPTASRARRGDPRARSDRRACGSRRSSST